MVVRAGNGGYGRLGHKEQKDEFSPKQVEVLKGRMPVDANSPVRSNLKTVSDVSEIPSLPKCL